MQTKRHREPKKGLDAPTSDVAVLKRKRRRADTVTVEKPLQSDPSHSKPLQSKPEADAQLDDVALLRTKQAQAERPRTVPPAPAPPPPVPHCRIVWWRGYMSSEFHARVTGPGGDGACVATSPSFRWRKSIPPPRDLPAAADAHATLLAQLEADGWSVAANGGDWFALELRNELRRER